MLALHFCFPVMMYKGNFTRFSGSVMSELSRSLIDGGHESGSELLCPFCTSHLKRVLCLLSSFSLSIHSVYQLTEVAKLILSSPNKFCERHYIPTFLLNCCLHQLIFPITEIINVSLSLTCPSKRSC